MEGESDNITAETSVNKLGSVMSGRENVLETPRGFNRITEMEGRLDFSGFKEEKNSTRRIIDVEREVRIVKETLNSLLVKYDKLSEECEDLRKRDEHYQEVIKVNGEVMETVEELKNENEALKYQCKLYEEELKEINNKVSNQTRSEGGVVSTDEVEKLKNAWQKETEEQKVNFREIVKQQVKEKTKETVIQVIREKESLVRDTVDKKKCIVVFGVKEKRNPVKHTREKEERDVAKGIIRMVQDEDQNFDGEIEEVYRIGRYTEGGKRPLKIKMRSQVSVEEILARTGKLADKEEFKGVWIKRDMNLEEREREKKLREEALEKNGKRTETEKESFIWRVVDSRLRKWYL